MAVQDEYVNQFSRIMDSLETIYGLDSTVNNNKLSDLTIGELIVIVNKNIAKKGKAELDRTNTLVWPHIGLLAHLLMRLQFHNERKLDYSNFPGLNECLEIVKVLAHAKGMTMENFNRLSVVIKHMSTVDYNLEFKSSRYLEYRYVRMLIIFILNKNLIESCVLSQFLLWHMGGEFKC